MLLGLITQVRNEMDIIKPFINHIDALFDRVYLIDHQSVDGTRELLKQTVEQRPGWRFYSLESKTKIQTATANLILHEAFADGVDFLFFLDADEFVEVNTREDLENELNSWKDHSKIGTLRWKNCISETFLNNEFTFQSALWVPQEESAFEKVIIPKELYADSAGKIAVSNGNHMVFSLDRGQIPTTRIGSLFHVPIRSRDQACRKVILTIVSYRGYKEWGKGNSFQYYEMLKKIAEGEVTDDDLRGYTLGFESPNLALSRVTEEDLLIYGYKVTSFEKLKIASTNRIQYFSPRLYLGFEQMMANALNNLESNIPGDVKLILNGDTIQIDEAALRERYLREELARKEQIKLLESTLKEREQAIRVMEVQFTQYEVQLMQYKEEVRSYSLSNSWKITRPFRRLKDFLRKKQN